MPQQPQTPQQLQIMRVKPQAPLPRRATAQSAGLDLRACIEQPQLMLAPGQRLLIPTGIAVALPPQTVGLVFGRSGLALRHGIVPANAVGVIDADYRGEIMVGLINQSDIPYKMNHGDRIAQLVVLPVLLLPVVEAQSLDETPRGTGGFGSTGR